mmetsp:Transcript_139993/g.435400  ORF Transcript_139993/g.435400 Transcript_139993/m.435400 type:complete len:215 (-) Transcript_139993:325-969(-)
MYCRERRCSHCRADCPLPRSNIWRGGRRRGSAFAERRHAAGAPAFRGSAGGGRRGRHRLRLPAAAGGPGRRRCHPARRPHRGAEEAVGGGGPAEQRLRAGRCRRRLSACRGGDALPGRLPVGLFAGARAQLQRGGRESDRGVHRDGCLCAARHSLPRLAYQLRPARASCKGLPGHRLCGEGLPRAPRVHGGLRRHPTVAALQTGAQKRGHQAKE